MSIGKQGIEVEVGGIGWKLLVSGDLSGVASWASGAFTAYDQLLLVIAIRQPTGTNRNLTMQFNGDTAGNYEYIGLAAATLTAYGGQNSIVIGTTQNINPAFGHILIEGKPQASATRQRVGVIPGGANQRESLVVGSWINGANITAIALAISADTMSGKVRIYGYNFP